MSLGDVVVLPRLQARRAEAHTGGRRRVPLAHCCGPLFFCLHGPTAAKPHCAQPPLSIRLFFLGQEIQTPAPQSRALFSDFTHSPSLGSDGRTSRPLLSQPPSADCRPRPLLHRVPCSHDNPHAHVPVWSPHMASEAPSFTVHFECLVPLGSFVFWGCRGLQWTRRTLGSCLVS